MHSTDPTSSESAVSHERAGDINEILAALDRDGYAIVPDAIDPSEVAKVRSSILELMGPTGRNSFEGFDTNGCMG